jgi:hypothetical protein
MHDWFIMGSKTSFMSMKFPNREVSENYHMKLLVLNVVLVLQVQQHWQRRFVANTSFHVHRATITR